MECTYPSNSGLEYQHRDPPPTQQAHVPANTQQRFIPASTDQAAHPFNFQEAGCQQACSNGFGDFGFKWGQSIIDDPSCLTETVQGTGSSEQPIGHSPYLSTTTSNYLPSQNSSQFSAFGHPTPQYLSKNSGSYLTNGYYEDLDILPNVDGSVKDQLSESQAMGLPQPLPTHANSSRKRKTMDMAKLNDSRFGEGVGNGEDNGDEDQGIDDGMPSYKPWNISGFPQHGETDSQTLVELADSDPLQFIQTYPNDLRDDCAWIIANTDGYRKLSSFVEAIRYEHNIEPFNTKGFSNRFGKMLRRAGQFFGPVQGYNWQLILPDDGVWMNARTWRKDGCPRPDKTINLAKYLKDLEDKRKVKAGNTNPLSKRAKLSSSNRAQPGSRSRARAPATDVFGIPLLLPMMANQPGQSSITIPAYSYPEPQGTQMRGDSRLANNVNSVSQDMERASEFDIEDMLPGFDSVNEFQAPTEFDERLIDLLLTQTHTSDPPFSLAAARSTSRFGSSLPPAPHLHYAALRHNDRSSFGGVSTQPSGIAPQHMAATISDLHLIGSLTDSGLQNNLSRPTGSWRQLHDASSATTRVNGVKGNVGKRGFPSSMNDSYRPLEQMKVESRLPVKGLEDSRTRKPLVHFPSREHNGTRIGLEMLLAGSNTGTQGVQNRQTSSFGPSRIQNLGSAPQTSVESPVRPRLGTFLRSAIASQTTTQIAMAQMPEDQGPSSSAPQTIPPALPQSLGITGQPPTQRGLIPQAHPVPGPPITPSALEIAPELLPRSSNGSQTEHVLLNDPAIRSDITGTADTTRTDIFYFPSSQHNASRGNTLGTQDSTSRSVSESDSRSIRYRNFLEYPAYLGLLSFGELISYFDEFIAGNDLLHNVLPDHNFVEFAYIQCPSIYTNMWKTYMKFVEVIQNNREFQGRIHEYARHLYLRNVVVRFMNDGQLRTALRLQLGRPGVWDRTDNAIQRDYRAWDPLSPYPAEAEDAALELSGEGAMTTQESDEWWTAYVSD
jgi:hypothetical protein